MKKVGRILIALIPMIAAMILQYASTYWYLLQDGMHGRDISHIEDDAAYMSELNSKSILTYAIIGFVVFGLWYIVGSKGTRYNKQKPTWTIKAVIAVVLLGVSAQFICTAALNIVNHFFPKALEGYAKMLEDSNIGQWNVVSFACTVMLAPALEEFVFRGMTIHFLKRAEINFYLVNFLQAMFFGIFHMNLVQGCYAFAIGLLLGYLYYKYNSIMIPIAVHMIINLTGCLLNQFGDKIPETMKAVYIYGGSAVLVMFIGCFIACKDKTKVDTLAYDYE